MTPEQIAADLLLKYRGHQPEELMEAIANALRTARNEALEEARGIAAQYNLPDEKTHSPEYDRGWDTCARYIAADIERLKHKDGQP